MMSKYFFHAFVSGKSFDRPPDPPYGRRDTIGCLEIRKWVIAPNGVRTNSASDRPEGFDCWFDFAKGNRFYIVENHGQCQEPNGEIIWRNEDGAQGDDKPA